MPIDMHTPGIRSCIVKVRSTISVDVHFLAFTSGCYTRGNIGSSSCQFFTCLQMETGTYTAGELIGYTSKPIKFQPMVSCSLLTIGVILTIVH